MKYVILVGHAFYGGCYPDINDNLTKDRDEAKRFNDYDNFDEVKKNESFYGKKFGCKCYAQTIQL